jgi:type I restriction enzyme S subunit
MIGPRELKIPADWRVLKFWDIATVRQGLQIAISDRHKECVPGTYPYITIQYLNNLDDDKSIFYIENPGKRVICKTDDILLTRTGNTGVVVTGVEGVFHNNFFLVDFNRGILHKEFLVYLLRSDFIQRLIRIYAGITTIPDLNHGDFYRIPVLIPPLSEQERIATMLSRVDALISNAQESRKTCVALKKGLMQHLLTQGIGHTKLKKTKVGEIPESWKVSTLVSVAEIRSGKKISGFERIPRIPMHLVPLDKIYTDFEILPLEDVKSYTYCESGDILLPKINPSLANGKIGIVPETSLVVAAATTEVYPIRVTPDIETLYLYYILKSTKYRNILNDNMRGTTGRQRVPIKIVEGLTIPVPPLEEQNQIVNTLLSVDELGQQEESALIHLNDLKKGLMQLLLTGKVRVKV